MAEGGIVSLGFLKLTYQHESRLAAEVGEASIPVSHVREIADLSLKEQILIIIDNLLPSPLHFTHTFPIGDCTELNTLVSNMPRSKQLLKSAKDVDKRKDKQEWPATADEYLAGR